jgi:hypothetical protein
MAFCMLYFREYVHEEVCVEELMLHASLAAQYSTYDNRSIVPRTKVTKDTTQYYCAGLP